MFRLQKNVVTNTNMNTRRYTLCTLYANDEYTSELHAIYLVLLGVEVQYI